MPWNHHNRLPYQIKGEKPVTNVQIDAQTTEIWPKHLNVTLSVSGRVIKWVSLWVTSYLEKSWASKNEGGFVLIPHNNSPILQNINPKPCFIFLYCNFEPLWSEASLLSMKKLFLPITDSCSNCWETIPRSSRGSSKLSLWKDNSIYLIHIHTKEVEN